MLVFRLVFGLLLLAALLCFAMSIGTGQPVWRRRGILVLKWALLAAMGFFGVLILERLAVML
jgi:hypothetical protein